MKQTLSKYEQKRYKLLLTLTRAVNFCLSSGGLPRLAGYSQSRSRPSKPWSVRKVIEWSTKSWRIVLVATILEKSADPMFQPPTASRVFSCGFRALRLFTLSYLQQ